MSAPASSRSPTKVRRRSCGEKAATFARVARRSTTCAIAPGVIRRRATAPPLVTGKSNGPGSGPRTTSHAARACRVPADALLVALSQHAQGAGGRVVVGKVEADDLCAPQAAAVEQAEQSGVAGSA